MQKWEYLVVDVFIVSRGNEPTVTDVNFRNVGEEVDAQVPLGRVFSSKETKYPTLLEYLSQLGELGWELVGSDTGGARHLLYFKRPKP